VATVRDILERHNKYQDSLLFSFESNLREIVMRAQGRTIAILQGKLKMDDGVILATPGNMAQLRAANQLFLQQLEDAGYSRLAEAFVGEFRGTLPFLRETLELLGNQVGQKWDLSLTQKDTGLLAGVQANTVWALEDAMQAVSGQAIMRGLFGVAGLRFGSLVELLTDKLETSIGRARTVADTGMSTFYRTASSRAYDIIQKDVPGQVLRYRYSGPDDKLTRHYCEEMLARTKKKGLTREEIDQYPNGQLPNPFLTGGGFNCRHGYYLDVSEWESDVKEPAQAARPARAA